MLFKVNSLDAFIIQIKSFNCERISDSSRTKAISMTFDSKVDFYSIDKIKAHNVNSTRMIIWHDNMPLGVIEIHSEAFVNINISYVHIRA